MHPGSIRKFVIDNPSRLITFTARQLQKKFKHASVLGIEGNYNKENAQKFRGAIRAFVEDPEVQQIVGTFRRDPVIHYLKESTLIDVMTETDGAFISVWELDDAQCENLIERGSL